MTDSIQKIIDDMKATAENANYHDFPQEYKHLMIFTERLEALQKDPVAWADNDTGTFTSLFQKNGYPLIRAD